MLIAHPRKRNKLTKACNNCQRRKVKCDRKIPTCSACTEKDFRCLYNVKVQQVRRTETHGLTRAQLIAKVEQLTTQLNEKFEKGSPNALCSLNYVSCKHGRVLSYGATSFRCTVTSSLLRPHFGRLWKKIKITRNQWKKEHRYSMETEANSIEMPLSYITPGSILEGLCASLPCFQSIVECIQTFFESRLFSHFAIIDPCKVSSDVSECLICVQKPSGESRITGFELGEKKNYYRIGIITEILCLIYYKDRIPPSIGLFHKFITSFVLGKASYLERVQFFMLRYIYRNVTGFTGGDGGSCTTLVTLAFSTATHIGLHKIESLNYFRDDPTYLANLWVFILYADFEVSFSIGSPLHISEDYVSNFPRKADFSSTQSSTKAFVSSVLFLRNIMAELYAPFQNADLETIISKLKIFYSANYKPISFYLKKQTIEFRKLLIMLFVLQLISNLCLIRISLLGCQHFEMEKDVLFCQLSSLKLLLDNLQQAYDVFQGSEDSHGHRNSMDFSLALYLYHCMIPRITHELFSILSKSALAEGARYQSNENCVVYHDRGVSFEDFLVLLESYPNGRKDLQFKAITAVAFLDTIYKAFLERCSEDLLLRLHQSYLFVLSDTFIASTKDIIESIVSASHIDETEKVDAYKIGSLEESLFEPIIDFFHDEDFPVFFS
ncbi:hypothetical protein BZL39_N00300 [Zygosaccharomyces parabailii]|nr:hypothetical protein BZL39_N00300 [Zygosaccharomyces parabailii]CDH11196.1 uncharacterized protein ZBAI_02982 [Zygosaccharomyces bailii ISA1307]